MHQTAPTIGDTKKVVLVGASSSDGSSSENTLLFIHIQHQSV